MLGDSGQNSGYRHNPDWNKKTKKPLNSGELANRKAKNKLWWIAVLLLIAICLYAAYRLMGW